MRKMFMATAAIALMAAPAFAAVTATNPEFSGSIGGGISTVSGGGVGNLGSESSIAGTQSATSVENGSFNTGSTGTDVVTQQAQLADGTWSPSSVNTTVTDQTSSGTFSDTAQSSEAFGGETGGGVYKGTAIEGGVSDTESGTFPVYGFNAGF